MNYYGKVEDAVDAWDVVSQALIEVRDTVCATMGPGAGFVAIAGGRIGGAPLVTDDGVTVSTFLKYKDPLKNAISMIVNDAARTTVRIAGDGTTTATLLTAELTLAVHAAIELMKNEGQKVITRAVCDDLRLLLSKTIEFLNGMVLDVDTQEVLGKVALIACHSNKEIAKVVSEAVWKVGQHGRVFIEDSADEYIKMVHENGYIFGHKHTPTCFDERFIMDKAKGETVLQNPLIFIADEEFDTYDKVEPILKAYVDKMEVDARSGKKTPPLLMIVSDCFGSARATLLQNFKQCPVFVIKTPEFNERRANLLADIAWLTNTPKVFSNLAGNVLENFGDEYEKNAAEGQLVDKRWKEFGQAKEVKFGKNICVIKHNKAFADIEVKVEELKSATDYSNSPEDREFYNERISKLVGGVATVYVGSHSETETTNAKLSVDDTIRSCFCAIKEGILPGAGVALKEARHSLKQFREELNYPVIMDCFNQAILTPYAVIRTNLGVEVDLIKVEGFDSMINPVTGEICDALDAGIVDPLLVTKTALMSAVSAATQLISTRKYIYSENA